MNPHNIFGEERIATYLLYKTSGVSDIVASDVFGWTEIVSKRNQKAKTFYNPKTKKYKTEIAVSDIHYHDGSAWQEINESLTDDGQDGFVHKCDRVRHIIRIGDDNKRRWYPRRDHPTEYVEFGRLQGWTGSAWADIELGTPTRAGQKIAWSTTNFDLSLTNTWHKIKLEAILKTETAKRRLRWAVSLNNLTWDNWQLHGLDDEVAGIIENLVAWDAEGSHDDPNVTITYAYSGGYVEFGGDLSQAVLPITIDPTFQDGQGGDVDTYNDTYLSKASAAHQLRNYGVATAMDYSADTSALYRFNLSSISDTATCGTGADAPKLYLYRTVQGTDSAFTDTFYSVGIDNKDWIEGTRDNSQALAGQPCWDALAADGAGGVTTAWHGSAGCRTSGEDYEATALGTITGNRSDAVGTEYIATLDSSRIEGWFGVANTNYGLLGLKTSVGNCGLLGLSDNATAGYRPKLVVVYTEGPSHSPSASPSASPSGSPVPGAAMANATAS